MRAKEIKNLVRGLNPIMGAYTFLDGKKIKFWKVQTLTENELLEKFYQQNKISVRAYNKILKVARTIADLEEKENIEYKHIAEALQYRRKEENL